MSKQKITKEYTEGSDYNLPMPKALKTGRDRVAFKPNESEFHALLDNAYRSKLTEIIKSGLNQYSESNVVRIRNNEDSRKKVPQGIFESLDTEYGSYWTVNTAKRLKLNSLDLYITYVQTHFDSLLKELKEKLHPEDQREVVQLEEQTRAIVVPLHQVLRRDLPPDMRATIMEKYNTALSQCSDYGCILSFVVEMAMKTFTHCKYSTSIQIDSIIPTEFWIDTSPVSLPTAPKYPTSDDISYTDYKNLFPLTHLQVVSILNFGTAGVQNQTRKNHPFWTEIQNCVDTVKSPEQENIFIN